MIEQIINKLEIPGKLIYLSQYGSHLYGLNTENSDLDFRGVYIPNLADIILHKDKDEINTELEVEVECYEEINKVVNGFPIKGAVKAKKVKVDVKIFSLQKFIQLCSKADTNALDLLFSFGIGPNGEVGIQPEQQVYCPLYNIMFTTLLYRYKLINIERLESPITYAFKQATKYGLKGERRSKLLYVLEQCNKFLSDAHEVKDLIEFLNLDNKYLKIDELDNKGTIEKYLNVCGVQHQFNLQIKQFKQRIQDKIDKEYTSQRTKDAADGNDWKALSHAIRIIFEIKELLDKGTITFPCPQASFLLDIKQGNINREQINDLFDRELNNILDRIQNIKINWNYDEEFFNNLILQCYGLGKGM